MGKLSLNFALFVFMPKNVSRSHILAERGVLKFNDYCNRHEPAMLFKEGVKHDFGIDGEVEITKKNEGGNLSATGELLKVQIKSTESDDSYIKNETDKTFNFYPRKEDIEYWNQHKLSVLVVIYDSKKDTLYCKKVNQEDLLLVQKKHRSIIFSKEDNKLEFGKNDFVEKFSAHFKGRVNYDTSEIIVSNLLDFSVLPKLMYIYETSFTNKKDVYEKITTEAAPFFSIYNKKIYSFENLKIYYRDFYTLAVEQGVEHSVSLAAIQSSKDLSQHFMELLNLYIKKLMSDKRLKFSKDYKRYYFRKPNDANEFKISYKSRKQKRSLEKNVVKYFEYGKDTFFRHWALEVKPFIISKRWYLIFNPKYYFTIDGKETLTPEKITTYTNYLTARERNQNVLSQIHFYLDYFSGGNNNIDVWNFNGVEIRIKSDPLKFTAGFSIPIDVQARKVKESMSPFPFQNKLLFDED